MWVIRILREGTPRWATILTIALAAWGVRNGCTANQIASQSDKSAQKANKIAEQSLNIAQEVHKAKDIPRLVAHPLGARFYTPTDPEVSGQVKIDMGAVIENLSETDARYVSVNFETLDWYDHRTSLFQIYEEYKRPRPILLSLPKGSRFVYPSYAPDAPATGESGYVGQDKPFKLKLSVYWKDINEREYVHIGVYDLKAAPLPDGKNMLYFQPLQTLDSVKDGEVAWERAKEPI